MKAKKQRRGATAVEFALVASVYFVLVLGIFEFGRALMVMQMLIGAAQAASRTGVIEGTTTAQITTAAKNYLTGVGISTETVTVQVNDGSADASTAKAGDEITVSVSIPVTDVTWVPGGVFPVGTLTGQYTLRRD